MDPELRTKLARPADPANDSSRVLEVYSLWLNGLLTISEGRTASALRSLDDCNAANAQLAKDTAPAKHPWWVLWAR